ncbi:hypothetical protein AC249_AIPGENE26812, partial [Exaiptasia diaphana]
NNVTSFTIIKKKGKFHKTLAIDEATKSIKDGNSIVFLTDLHLTAPHDIFESVRKTRRRDDSMLAMMILTTIQA